MSFDELLDAVRQLMERDGRVAYRVLKRRFELDDEDIEDIKADLIDAKRLARDEDNKVLVWIGDAGGASDPSSQSRLDNAHAVPDSADRRLITVMFCDIVGSTELSGRFDAEELRDLVREYQGVCAEVITRFDGHIAQYLGDGLLVYFGYPVAQEDEAGRSIQAALEILDALSKAETLQARLGEPLRVRVGIHTGPVVIGEMGGADRHERLALGETPNIAARVQGSARPNEILITAATHRLVDGLYECELHGPHSLKGVAQPIDLYTVKGEAAPLNRFEVALSTGALSEFVGRQQELQLLARHWAEAREGRGHVVLLSGEAGMGKSRLVQEFKKEVGDDARQITLRCSPNHQNSAYYPIVQLLRRVFGIENDDSEAMRIQKMESALEPYAFTKPETAPLFASLLSLDHPDQGQLVPLDPQARKTLMFEALIDWFLEEATARPAYVIWDDVHWMDPASAELLDLYLDHIPASRTLALVIYRSDFVLPWNQRTFFEHLSIGRLPETEVEAIIMNVAERETIPAELLRHIKDKTDGIPLYVEELTKTIVEADLLEQADKGGITEPLQDIAIPATLHDSLEARIDRCPSGKHIAQWGAVIGREFGYELLTHLVDDRAVLSRGLEELLDAELLYRSGTRADPSYIFKHALIRDTAYESLLNKHRRARHAEIAAVLEQHYPETVQREPELVAYHFAEAGIHERAVEHLYAAGQRAVERSAALVAQGHLDKALKIVASLPDTVDRARLELKILLLLGPLVSASQGNSSAEVETVYKRALKLCRQAQDSTSRFPAYFGLRAYYLAKSDLKSAHEIGQALYKAAKSSGRAEYLLEANVALISSHFFRGDIAAAERHISEGLKLYDRSAHSKHAFIYGVEPGSICLVRGAQNAWLRGYPDQALRTMQQALDLADDIGHAVSRAFVYGNACTLHGWLGQHEQAETYASMAIDIADEFGIAFAHGWSLIQRGHARVCLARHDAGLADIEDGMAILEKSTSAEAVRSQLMYSWFMTLTADAYGRTGDPEKGLALLPEAIALIEKTGARYPEPVLYRVRGELLHRLKLHSEAGKSILKSLEIAQTRGAKSFELQAAISLAKLWGEQGRGQEARETLSAVVSAFTEGFESYDFCAAKSLLDELN
ncbi:MAG: AAA family ATPase [Proteobacteria bacterium]|nr:AAA family ATPase [Pseudomonadota bacterium]